MSSFTKVVIGFVVIVAAILLVLNPGGNDAPTEGRGDLSYIEGEVPERRSEAGARLVASIADITNAGITAEGDEIVFTAEVASPVPQPLKTSGLEFRWDLEAEDGSAWTVAAAVARDAQVAVFNDSGYGSGTIDDTLPGSVSINDKTIEVRFRSSAIEDFPESFEWSLASTLRAFRSEVDSPRVEDRFPDEEKEQFED